MTREEEYAEAAFEMLYNHLDQYGATKRMAYLISSLIDAKIAEALKSAPESPSASQTTPASSEPQTAASEAINWGRIDLEAQRNWNDPKAWRWKTIV